SERLILESTHSEIRPGFPASAPRRPRSVPAGEASRPPRTSRVAEIGCRRWHLVRRRLRGARGQRFLHLGSACLPDGTDLRQTRPRDHFLAPAQQLAVATATAGSKAVLGGDAPARSDPPRAPAPPRRKAWLLLRRGRVELRAGRLEALPAPPGVHRGAIPSR